MPPTHFDYLGYLDCSAAPIQPRLLGRGCVLSGERTVASGHLLHTSVNRS
jgi:hypothetical protein